jgi:very-short-patch-repair endonuclease
MDAREEVIEHARRLRRSMTRAEVVLWQRLRASRAGAKIRRQHPFGPYVLDFFCKAASLAIEVDGTVHDKELQAQRDASRDRHLLRLGVRTLRVTSAQVMSDPDRVVEVIKRWIERSAMVSNDHRQARRPDILPASDALRASVSSQREERR